MGTDISQNVIDTLLFLSWLAIVNVAISCVVGIFVFLSGNKEWFTRQVQWIVMMFILSVTLFLIAHSNQILRLPTP